MTSERGFDRGVRLVSMVAILGLGVAISSCSKRSAEQQTFATPEAAVQAMFQAVSKGDTTAIRALLGPDASEVVNRADPVQAARERQVIAAAMIERWWLEGEGSTRTIVVGNESYPLPIPLVEEKGRWRFDTAAGKEEMLYRRIGRNELAVMDVADAFVIAQHEYAAKSHDGVPKGTFAQRFLSEPGRHDGLFWPATPADPVESPMGELAAKAADEGYRRQEGRFHWHAARQSLQDPPGLCRGGDAPAVAARRARRSRSCLVPGRQFPGLRAQSVPGSRRFWAGDHPAC